MDIHHGCTCRACGRALKRHHGKRWHCGRSSCRQWLRVMGSLSLKSNRADTNRFRR